jgi:hypothetical protein
VTNTHRSWLINGIGFSLSGGREAQGQGLGQFGVCFHLLAASSRGRREEGSFWGPFSQVINPICEGSTTSPSHLPKGPLLTPSHR